MAHIIGINGCSGSGKTSFCHKFVEKLQQSGNTVCFISSDWFYKTTHEDPTSYNFDVSSAFDFQPLINAIKEGKPTKLPSYDYINHCSIPDINEYNPNVDFIIIEGIMLYNDPELRQLITTKIFVHTDLDACLARRILRDIKERGRTVQSVITQWFKTVKPGYEQFIEPTMKYCDYIFDNTKENIDYNIFKDTKLIQLFEKLFEKK
jgi:uridine kinase